MNLKEIHYGIEIETVKRTREQIAWAIHSVVGGTVRHVGIPSSYDPWEVEDLRGRVWKVVGDASLTSVPAHLRAEVVSPVLGYDDIPQLQEAVRAIRRAGARSTASAASTSISTPRPSTAGTWVTWPRSSTSRSR
jgi:Putative amidoligase enzyme.